jgi:membrane-associated phospholipid phosphatase
MRIFLIIILLVYFFKLSAQNVDFKMFRTINVERNHSLDKPMLFITNSITPVLVATPIVMYAVGYWSKLPENNQKTIAVIGALGLAGASTFLLKNTFRRERPFNTYSGIEKLTSGGSYSFPSGHTSSAFSLATSVSLCYPKWYVITPSFLYAGLVGYSRMHLGVHYPSDVLMGALLGAGSAYLSHYLTYKFYPQPKLPVTANIVLEN